LATAYNLVTIRRLHEYQQKLKWRQERQLKRKQEREQKDLKQKDLKQKDEQEQDLKQKDEQEQEFLNYIFDMKAMQQEIKSCLCQARSFNLYDPPLLRYAKAIYKKRAKRRTK
jgi:hypothetical protein